MADFDQICDSVLRAAYQISGCTGSPVLHDQIIEAVPLSTEDLLKVVAALQKRGLVPAAIGSDQVALTPAGVSHAARLPATYEPPLFQDI